MELIRRFFSTMFHNVKTPEFHHVFRDRRIVPPFPDGFEQIQFGMGCFWGAEKKFWSQKGVYSTAVGFSGGETPKPSYHEARAIPLSCINRFYNFLQVCSGATGHAEVILVVFDPKETTLAKLLKGFLKTISVLLK